MAVFCDLNIPWPKDRKLLVDRIATAIKLGYEAVVINNTKEDIKGKKEKKKEKQEPAAIQKPEEIKLDVSTIESLQVGSRTVEQYTRLTAILDDSSPAHKLNTSPVIKDYDIVAVQPTTEKTFAQACSVAEIEVICLNLTERLPFHLTRSMLGVAVERGVHFEIIYSPAITDASSQKHIISNAMRLVEVLKGKNIVISSGCQKPIDLRGPYDVANLALLFGLTEAQAKDAISTNCRSVIMHGKSRKVAGCVVKMSKVPDLQEHEKWKVEQLEESEDEEEDVEESENGHADEDSENGNADKESENGNADKESKNGDTEKESKNGEVGKDVTQKNSVCDKEDSSTDEPPEKKMKGST